MAILVTGGTGYIGSHTVVELLNSGYDVVIADNLSNSKKEVLDRIYQITNKRAKFYLIDVCNKNELRNLFTNEKIDSVIHFAGYKAVGESVKVPLKYYNNNLISAITLLEVMLEYNVTNIIFSSSATVYGTPESVPIDENAKVGGTSNPYGTTKCFIEQIMIDTQKANPNFNVVLLRYFNPIGAHKSGLIGEDPQGIPNNLMPYILQVAVGRLPELGVYGNDYPTIDGTGVRDYIHVCDLAAGHVKALDKIKENCGLKIYNLGTGEGVSVLQFVDTFEKVNNIKIPYSIVPRRAGDLACYYASNKKAVDELKWSPKYNLEDACKDSYNWQKKNPKGYN